jgi:hypothetical protein
MSYTVPTILEDDHAVLKQAIKEARHGETWDATMPQLTTEQCQQCQCQQCCRAQALEPILSGVKDVIGQAAQLCACEIWMEISEILLMLEESGRSGRVFNKRTRLSIAFLF